jgi:formylglycine-generating enzyme required for sulfatase activity/uncharacterized caspase-like protein
MAKVALLIGVSEYQAGLNSLPAAVKDVQALQRVLQDRELGEFDQVKTLLNPDPYAMQFEIETFFTGRTKDDLVLLYFSGHGIKDDRGNLYFATRITHKNANGDLVRTSAVSAQFVHDMLDNSRARRQAIILDCCFSGAFDPSLRLKDDGSVNLPDQLGAEGRVVLTSSSSTQYSLEQSESELSLYTRYLVEGIETGAGDLDEDGKITIKELHHYASDRVRATAPSMTPKLITLKDLGFEIILSKARVTNPQLQYRKTVARFSTGDKIRPAGRAVLDTLRQHLGLTQAETDAIESEVLRSYREHLINLKKYRNTLLAEAEHEYPLSQKAQEVMVMLQKLLGLREEDVAPILQQIEAKFNQRNKPALSEPSQPTITQSLISNSSLSNIQRSPTAAAEFDDLSDHAVVIAGQRLEIPTIPDAQLFEFEALTIDAHGRETNRRWQQAQYLIEDINGLIFEMVVIPGGSFLMGSSERKPLPKELPVHLVTIKPFLMSKYPVTKAQWKAVASLPQVNQKLVKLPSRPGGANHPVVKVSWYDAVEFCARLSQKTGHEYRLATEAEWEYACRAGTTTPFHFGETITSDLANYDGTRTFRSEMKGISREKIVQVGSFSFANAFGLFDMHGNVWEWCLDHWHENYEGAPEDGSAWIDEYERLARVIRGGAQSCGPTLCRSTSRASDTANISSRNVGFRIVRSLSL